MGKETGTFFKTATQTSYERSSFYARRLEPQKDLITYLGDIVRFSETQRLIHVMKLKRVFDIVCASIALVFGLPLLAIAAVCIKLESRGPVFFVQERIGLNRRRSDRRTRIAGNDCEDRSGRDRRTSIQPGQPFRIYKLRTMRTDAETSGPTLACEDDPRITRVGLFLRKTRIDEVPQFLNVIKGEMSIIGPRPERSFFINQIKHDLPEFPLRLVVKPGITGLAQVEDGYTQTLDRMKDKLFYDLKYIAELSVFQEFKILVKTVSVVFTGKGAC